MPTGGSLQPVPEGAVAVRSARIAVSTGFFLFGMTLALWAVHIPTVAARLQIDHAVLGLALLNIGLGGVVSQPLTGWLVARIGSRGPTTVFLLLDMVTFCFAIVAWNVWVFFVATFAIGIVGGATNVAVNTQASEIERLRGKPTMSSFHGFFSLGALAGSLVGAGILVTGLADGTGAFAAAIVLLGVAALASRWFLTNPPSTPAPAEAKGRRGLALPLGVLVLSVLVFFSNMVEGSVNDWSALYLSTERGFSDAAAASGFALFSLAMAICRLAGGPVVTRLGERKVVLFGGVLMAIGMTVVVLTPWNLMSPFGFALIALGAANTIPVMISAASRTPGIAPSSGIAAAATGALLGFLIGPPLIGFVAHAFGLTTALGSLSAVGIIVAVGATFHRWPEPASLALEPAQG
jgi:MFS family permease